MEPIVTCQPLPEGQLLPKVKPFHVQFYYHHTRFGDGQQMAREAFKSLQFDLSVIETIEADAEVDQEFKARVIERLKLSIEKDSETIEKGLAIYRTAEHNLNQWGSGEQGHPISRNFEFLNPENLDFY